MSPRVSKNMLFNAHIFTINGSPMRFYLEGYDESQCHQISKIIEAHGGKFSFPDTNTIIFSEPGRYTHTNRRKFHIKCLRDSIVDNKLQDINKYSLPWRINQSRKNSSSKDTLSKSGIGETSLKKSSHSTELKRKVNNYSLPEPYILIEDCLTTHPATKQQRLSSSCVTGSQGSKKDSEQSRVISSFKDDVSPSCVPPKTADKSSSTAVKPPKSQAKRPLNFRSCGLSRRSKSLLEAPPLESNDKKRIPEDLPLAQLRKAESVEIIAEMEKQSPAEVILISDSEDCCNENTGEKKSESQNSRSTSAPLADSEIDGQNSTLNFELPNSYAVWSKAGPPGPPHLSDGEGQRKSAEILDTRKIKKEKDSEGPRTRGRTRFRYDECNTSDSDESDVRKTRSKTKGRKNSYEWDRSYSSKNSGRRIKYTKEDNQKMIRYLIDNDLINKSTSLHVWIKFSIKKILRNSTPSAKSLQRHFEDQVIFNFEKYTDDPIAIEAFKKIRDNLI
ncbi:uncharacterized protein [Fopius arisanus]|uniref:Uncharacterized protein n=1 Tax=Fopius arisanus TaxID=64838 RepID=A0A9R1T1V3_9HYME|nr:PREDICTED: uncharacterized protein LOC105265394 [Fopius arisanus]